MTGYMKPSILSLFESDRPKEGTSPEDSGHLQGPEEIWNIFSRAVDNMRDLAPTNDRRIARHLYSRNKEMWKDLGTFL